MDAGRRLTKRAINQKSERVERWLDEKYPAIYRKAKAENAEVFWEDETAGSLMILTM